MTYLPSGVARAAAQDNSKSSGVFDKPSPTSAVSQTPRNTRSTGNPVADLLQRLLSGPIDTARGVGDPAVDFSPETGGLLGGAWQAITQGAGNVARAGLQYSGNVGKELLAGASMVPTTEDVVNAVRSIPGADRVFGSRTDQQTPTDDIKATSPEIDAETTLNNLNSNISFASGLDDLLEGGMLTPESQAQVVALREELAMQIEANTTELKRLQGELHGQDLIFGLAQKRAGIDLDLDPLANAIQQEGGLGEQTRAAIDAIVSDATMSTGDQQEAMDLVLQRAHFSNEIVVAINDLVRNQKALEEAQSLPDWELLGDEADFMQMAFPNAIELDPALRWQYNIADVVSQALPSVQHMNEDQEAMYLNAVAGLSVNPQDQRARDIVTTLAQQLGLPDGTELYGAIINGIAQATTTEDAAALAVNAKKLTPGSEAMAIALASAGANLDVELPPDVLAHMVNDRGIHTLINLFSKGRAGYEEEGSSIKGVGGLTEEMYQAIMGEPWTPDRGMEWELQALLQYVYWGFDGDPLRAIQLWKKTGTWGGSDALVGPTEEAGAVASG